MNLKKQTAVELPSFSHLATAGAKMVDVAQKPSTQRSAIARCRIQISPELSQKLATESLPKGQVFITAQLAGIMAAKKTHELIPLCHNLTLESVRVNLTLSDLEVRIEAESLTTAKTGVEMEALMACQIASLTVYDMCKSVDKGMLIKSLGLYRKTGGRSGDYQNPELEW